MVRTERDFANWVAETMSQRGRVVIHSRGRSMHPAIPDGAQLEVRPVAFDELQPGDIVVYEYAGEVFCHRLLRKGERLCVLKGDTLLSADPPVAWSQVIGRVMTLIQQDIPGRAARLIPLDTPMRRRHARLKALLSYPAAYLFHAKRSLRRCLHSQAAIRLSDD